MTNVSNEDRFRTAAESEGGIPISAGARLAHVRLAAESGRNFYVDLSGVPEDRRLDVVAEIKELVNRASTSMPQMDPGRTPGASTASG